MNARDHVVETIVEEVERYLKEAEEDQCFLNDTVAYLRCLTGVCDWAGGSVEVEQMENWHSRANAVIRAMPESMYPDGDAERQADLEFISEVFDDLKQFILE